jgi:hypothetical protein
MMVVAGGGKDKEILRKWDTRYLTYKGIIISSLMFGIWLGMERER